MSIREDTAQEARSSKVVWESLESFVRGEVQQFIQALLEEEVTELLGRARSQRRSDPEKGQGAPVYRNGYGKPRLCRDEARRRAGEGHVPGVVSQEGRECHCRRVPSGCGSCCGWPRAASAAPARPNSPPRWPRAQPTPTGCGAQRAPAPQQEQSRLAA